MTIEDAAEGPAQSLAGADARLPEEVPLEPRVYETLPPEAISDQLRPVVEELGLVESCRQLAAEGWTIVENAASPEFFDRLRKAIVATTEAADSRSKGRLLREDAVFAEAATNPSVMALAEFSVGRGCLLGSLIGTKVLRLREGLRDLPADREQREAVTPRRARSPFCRSPAHPRASGAGGQKRVSASNPNSLASLLSIRRT